MARNSSRSKIVAAFGLTLLLGSQALAFTYNLNAMCYVGGKDNEVHAFNPTDQEIKDSDSIYVEQKPTNVTNADLKTKYRIASLSKMLVSHWAIAKLGPEYRFKTTFLMTGNRDDSSCDVHIKGDYDIFLGKEILSSAFRQLKDKMDQQGCKQIAHLTYDENVVIPNFGGSNYIVQHRDSAGFRGSNPTNYYGPKTTLNALTRLVRDMTPIHADDVALVSSSDFETTLQSTPMQAFSFKSRPLYMILREFNTVSSNVPPNILFEKLGGRSQYNKFIKDRLSLDTSEVDLRNGSGYPVVIDGKKIYNEVSCEAFVRVMQDMDQLLHAYEGSKEFQLADIMAVGGPNEGNSTLKTLYAGSTFDNTLTGKTGSAEQAITFGGMISTTEGPIYFGAFVSPSSYEQLNRPRRYIRDLVTVLMERYKLKKFDYSQIGLMSPLDSEAKLVVEDSNLSTKLK